jgi:ribosomal protein S18 acetylase RimI-like enzyme
VSSASRGTRARTDVHAVRLRPMTPAEFDTYLATAVDEYAAAVRSAGRAEDEAGAAALAAGSFERLLPDRLETPGHALLVAEDDATGDGVGILWFGPSSDDDSRAWIYDVVVEEERRGQGWGRAVLTAFEPEARSRGFTSAGLNVYGDNLVARHLYETMGYSETSRQMAKSL